MAELRKRTDQLPDDYWVVLVGDMITEEALPTYMAMLNTLDGVRDETGAANTPWGRYEALDSVLGCSSDVTNLTCCENCSNSHNQPPTSVNVRNRDDCRAR